jgi:hypothetical protein
MKSTIGAIVLIGGVMATAAAIALAGTTAFAETAAEDKRARLAILWGQDKAVTDSRAVSSLTSFTGIASVLRLETTGPWDGNYGAGRVEPPAGH